MYRYIGQIWGLGEWITPYGRQWWMLCRVRRPFRCAKSGKWWPEKTYAWRPTGNPKNRNERIAVDHSLDTRSIAEIVIGHPNQRRLVKELISAEKPMPLHQLSFFARLDYHRVMRALSSLQEQGLLRIVDEWGETADWHQSDGTAHQSYVIDFQS